MTLRIHLCGLALAALAAAGGAAAQTDKAKKQAEVRTVTAASLEKFYKAKPELKDRVAKAPGYAVFTTYGLSFIVGGAGGKGIAHDNKSGKDTFMDMAQASVGVQLGASQNETLIVFNTPAALKNFVDKGWEYGGGATAAAGGGGKTAGSGSGENVISDASYYTYTKNGFEAGGALQGTKFWKSGDLN